MATSEAAFREQVLEVVGEHYWARPPAIFEFLEQHLTREGARIWALEHCVFAAHFPRWFGSIVSNCPYLDARQYMIDNMYVEEVHDPTVTVGHYDSMVIFAVALGLDEAAVRAYQGHVVTRMALAYWDNAARSLPWVEAFAAVGGLEIKANRELTARYGKVPLNSASHYRPLGLAEEAMIHWASAEVADQEEGGHGYASVDIITRYAIREGREQAVLDALRASMEVNWYYHDVLGRRAIEASRQALARA
jgi:pyrroloquinoline-quinone synthase